MQQSSVIFANLLIAYLLFITLRGELPTYITLLRGGGKQPAGTGAGSAGNIITQGAQALLNDNPDTVDSSLITPDWSPQSFGPADAPPAIPGTGN